MLVISPWSPPTSWSCPTGPTGWRPAFPRASAVDRLERVAVGRLAPGVLERARYSASADVRDGLDGLGY